MEFEINDEVIYFFPTPINEEKTCFRGKIDFLGESFITIRNIDNILLRVSYKNFDWIKPVLESEAV
ncbi:MAG: hypothetical protein GXX85_07205 [Ignavibacteria bacterium]|nr:hypothetical protein [Ignavibacteria bacterium]